MRIVIKSSLMLSIVFLASCNAERSGPFDAKTEHNDKGNRAALEQRVEEEEPSEAIIPSSNPPPQELPQSGSQQPSASPSPAPAKKLTEEHALDFLPRGAEQLKVLCARGGQDKIRKVFCGGALPDIKSLADFEAAIGLGFTNPTAQGRNANGTQGNPGFVLSGHSSSLVARFTNAINPRAIIFSPLTGAANPEFIAMGFVRGETFVEIIAQDPVTKVPAFFLLKFDIACQKSEAKPCHMGDLLGPDIEKNWQGYTLYEDKDLGNTILDCKQCHQPRGEGTPKMLRMQELRNPWTHFFRNNTSGGPALIADYLAAKGNESYAGIPGSFISFSDPELLEDFTREQGFSLQPNEYLTGNIEREITQSAPNQPADNSVSGESATWTRQFESVLSGSMIAMPHFNVKVTDPTKLASLTQAYKDFKAGALAPDKLPDLRDAFKAADMWGMGLTAKPGLDGAALIKLACTQCHHDLLDQNLTRAKFNVNLSKMSREEKDLAIERVNLAHDDLKAMPPGRFRTLNAAEKALIVAELKK